MRRLLIPALIVASGALLIGVAVALRGVEVALERGLGS